MQTIDQNETGLDLRTKLNANFAEANNVYLFGAVNPNLATFYVFKAQGIKTLDATETNAFKYYLNGTDGISALAYHVRTDPNVDFELLTYANLILFLAGTSTTPTYSYSVGSTTNWQVKVVASFGASAVTKDYGIEMIFGN